MKDYKALHHIQGLSDNSILVYEAIRNLVGLFVLQQKYKDSFKKQKSGKLGSIGVTRNNNPVIGITMVITNTMLQEWIGDKSHNTIKAALEQLESMGFIKCATDGTKKSGRKITLLRDMEEYQPEEIDALETYLKTLGNIENIDCENVLPECENGMETTEIPVNKPEKKTNKNKTDKINDDTDDTEEDLDDFEF